MISPYDFIKTLTEKLPSDAIVVTANGSACVLYFQAGIVKKGQRVFWNSGCASMGWCLPASIGAAFANPGKMIICVEGDGSLAMSLSALQTVRHYELPIKMFLLNNSGYHSLQETYDNFCDGKHYGSDIGDLSFPDWQRMAVAFRIPNYKIYDPYAMDNMIDLVLKEEEAVLCEVILGKYKFKKDEI